MTKHKHLTDFIKPYKEQVKMDTPTQDGAKETTTQPLPELHTGQILRHRFGALYRVYRVTRSSRSLYDEPTYRLEKIDTIKIKGHAEFTGEELSEAGMQLYTEQGAT
jgi:hypothetical protein